jgi:hypothetical protein
VVRGCPTDTVVVWWRIDAVGAVHASVGDRLLVEHGHADAELRTMPDTTTLPARRG